MFGLSIHGGPHSNVLTIGRPGCLEAPTYFMRKDGKPVLRHTKFGPVAEHGQAAKDRDKASIRIGDMAWQIAPEPEEEEDAE